MRNVEVKYRLRDFAAATRTCERIGARHAATLEQRDTYYEVDKGRLKRRECPGRSPEWVQYLRPDDTTARASDYELFSDVEARRRFEPDRLAVRVVVDKVRELWLTGEVRIHLDRVHGVGECFEIEALVNERQDEAGARRELARILAELAPCLGDAIEQGYADLIEGSASS